MLSEQVPAELLWLVIHSFSLYSIKRVIPSAVITPESRTTRNPCHEDPHAPNGNHCWVNPALDNKTRKHQPSPCSPVKACLHFQQRDLLPFTDASAILTPKSIFFMHFKKILKIVLLALSAGRDRCPSHASHQGTGRSPAERQHAAVASSPAVSIISYIRSADRSEKPSFLSTLCFQAER